MHMFNKYKNPKKSFFACLMLLVFILSHSIFIIFNVSSMNASMLVGLILSLVLIGIRYGSKYFIISKEYLIKILFLWIVIYIQFCFSKILYDDINNTRFLFTVALLTVTMVISAFLFNFMNVLDEITFDKAVGICYYFLTCIGVVATIYNTVTPIESKSMVIFSEPSHFAIVYLPFLLYKIYKSKKKIVHLLLGLGIALIVQNLTLLAGIIMIVAIIYCLKKNIIFTILASGVVFLAFIFIVYLIGPDKLIYFTDRLKFGSDNLSVLVFMSGWERAYLSLSDSYGVGIGFQQLGIVGPIGDYMIRIGELLNGGYINLYDGGSVGCKLIAELGLLGIGLLVLYLIYLCRILIKFSKKRIDSNMELFLFSVYIMMFVQIFFRGVGYLSPYVFMFFVSVYYIDVYKYKIFNKNTNRSRLNTIN